MPVLKDGDVEVWILPGDPPKHVRCYVKGFEVIINLSAPNTVEAYDVELPSPSVLGKAMRCVQRNLAVLLQKWDEMNS